MGAEDNGAVTFYYPIESFPEKRFKLMIEVQVWAALHLSQRGHEVAIVDNFSRRAWDNSSAG